MSIDPETGEPHHVPDLPVAPSCSACSGSGVVPGEGQDTVEGKSPTSGAGGHETYEVISWNPPSTEPCPYCPDDRECVDLSHWKRATDYWATVAFNQMERAATAEANETSAEALPNPSPAAPVSEDRERFHPKHIQWPRGIIGRGNKLKSFDRPAPAHPAGVHVVPLIAYEELYAAFLAAMGSPGQDGRLEAAEAVAVAPKPHGDAVNPVFPDTEGEE